MNEYFFHLQQFIISLVFGFWRQYLKEKQTDPEIHFGAVVFNQIVLADTHVESLTEAMGCREDPTGSDQSPSAKRFLMK